MATCGQSKPPQAAPLKSYESGYPIDRTKTTVMMIIQIIDHGEIPEDHDYVVYR